MKKAALAVLVVSIVGWLFSFFIGGDREIVNEDSTGTTVVMFGDSLVQGVGARDGNTLPVALERMVDERIVNLGKSGDTTEAALSRVNQVVEHNPKITIILLGGNDALHKVDPEETFSNLKTIITRIQDAGSSVILVGVQDGLIGDGYKKRFESLAEETGSVLVPDILDGVIGNIRYMSDPIHPNNDGYQIMAEKIEPALESLLGK